ncbi:GNAT family N-acetyltransferase [Natrialba swarupiae]|uniref:GNAT family N-acetyltransferase n=1 Tax=Natrialba swarupiae TaxID=2448032 RepID=A0A5D5AMQ6_9EURY|nr:GNAT family N-acetyltransferase [Natrialba swarupiae]
MPGALFLAGERVELRTIESEDIEAVRRWMNHTEIRRYIDEFRYPTSRTEYEEWADDGVSSGRVDLLICVDGDPVGRIRLVPLDETRGWGNLGFVIGPDHCHNGYATEAADLIVEYAFTELRLHRLEGKALAPNEGSQRVLETLGFVREGRRREVAVVDGEYVDEVWYGLLRAEWADTSGDSDGA